MEQDKINYTETITINLPKIEFDTLWKFITNNNFCSTAYSKKENFVGIITDCETPNGKISLHEIGNDIYNFYSKEMIINTKLGKNLKFKMV